MRSGPEARYARVMTVEGQRLREKLRRTAAEKAASHVEMRDAHLALSLAERLEKVIDHSDAMIRLFPTPPLGDDDEAETWRRVHARLRASDPPQR
jgi:hypothetical protein